MKHTCDLSHEDLCDIYNEAPCGFHSLDKNGVIIHINNTELNWLGATRDEVVGKKRFIDFCDHQSVERFKKLYPVFMKQGWIKNVRFNIIRKDDTVLPVLVSATAVNDAKGNYLYSRSVLTDLSDRGRIEEALRGMDPLEPLSSPSVTREMKMFVLKKLIQELDSESDE